MSFESELANKMGNIQELRVDDTERLFLGDLCLSPYMTYYGKVKLDSTWQIATIGVVRGKSVIVVKKRVYPEIIRLQKKYTIKVIIQCVEEK